MDDTGFWDDGVDGVWVAGVTPTLDIDVAAELHQDSRASEHKLGGRLHTESVCSMYMHIGMQCRRKWLPLLGNRE